MTVLVVSVPERQILSFESQAAQYPASGPPGLSYYRGEISESEWVDCLLYRDDDGGLLGILNYYAMDFPPWEQAGNCNIWVRHDHRRQGIGTRLLREAHARWRLDFAQQRYTFAGARLAQSVLLDTIRTDSNRLADLGAYLNQHWEELEYALNAAIDWYSDLPQPHGGDCGSGDCADCQSLAQANDWRLRLQELNKLRQTHVSQPSPPHVS